MKYADADLVELVQLADECTKDDRSPEAELLRNTVHKNGKEEGPLTTGQALW